MGVSSPVKSEVGYIIEFVYYQFKDFMNDSSLPSKTRDVTSEYWLSWNSLPLTALNFWRNVKIRWPRIALFNSQAELKEITCPIFCLKYSFQYCSKIVSKQFNVDWPKQCIKDLSKINKKYFFLLCILEHYLLHLCSLR